MSGTASRSWQYAAAALVDHHHFYACIVWAVGYWFVYPYAWPLISGFTSGVAALFSRVQMSPSNWPILKKYAVRRW